MNSSVSAASKDQDYSWDLTPGYVPPHIRNLPRGHGFSVLKIIKFDSIVAQGVLGFVLGELLYGLRRLWLGKLNFQMTADLGFADMFKAINEWHRLEDFDYFYKPWTSFLRPSVADSWDTDREFGQARLCGINPAFIRKCCPEDLGEDGKFPSELIDSLLPDGTNLSEALTGERLYLLDYRILSNILTSDLEDQLGKYSTAPLCLLHVNARNQLMPIAIKLWQNKSLVDSSSNPIFTPKSSPQSWLTAKIAVSSADIAYQGIISHLLNTHLIVETFGVCTYRQLPPDHIVFQMLHPHFFNTFAINEMARGIFLGHNGFFDVTGALGFTGSNELLRRAYTGKGSQYEGSPHLFYQATLPRDLERRGVANLPGYYYRDDGLLIWDAIESYVTEILKVRYRSSVDLISDKALQAWKEELVSPEFGRIQGLLSPEQQDQVSGPLADFGALSEILTNVIFTATAQHSAVNFGQYEYAGFVPNMPFALYQSFSNVLPEHLPAVDLISRLPDRVQTIKQMILVKALSLPTPHSSPSLLTMKNPYRDAESRKIFQSFQRDRLTKIEQQITSRNESTQNPYVRLLPSNIAQSIAI
jgi:Lipoxygenase